MPDVVVTVPKRRWSEWIAEGDIPSSPQTDQKYYFELFGHLPNIQETERVYIVAHGRLRGYAPLFDLDAIGYHGGWYDFALIRKGGAVAVTIPEPIRGFRGWRYRWWERAIEIPFPDWRQP